jgi:hypothetical protein
MGGAGYFSSECFCAGGGDFEGGGYAPRSLFEGVFLADEFTGSQPY